MEGAGFERLTSTSSDPVAGQHGSPSSRQQEARQAFTDAADIEAREARSAARSSAGASGDLLGGGHSPNLVVRKTFLEVADSKPMQKSWWRRQHSEPARMVHGKDGGREQDSLSELSEDDVDIIDEPPSPRFAAATAAVVAEAGGATPQYADMGLGGGGFGGEDAYGDALGEDWGFGGEEAPKVLLLSESIPFRKARAQDRQNKQNYVVKDVSLTRQEPPWTEVTTVMMRNLPNKYTQQMLLEELQDAGFSLKHTFDFFYLPMDHSNAANLGYCFINFTETSIANAFAATFGGNKMRRFNSNKTVVVMPASIQGFEKNYAYYASTRVVQAEDPAYRPLFLRPDLTGQADQSPNAPGAAVGPVGAVGAPGGKGSQQPPLPMAGGKGRPPMEDLDISEYPHHHLHRGHVDNRAMDYGRPEPDAGDFYGVGAGEMAARYGHFLEATREAELRIAAASRLGGMYEDFGSAPPFPGASFPAPLPPPPMPKPKPEAPPPPATRPKAPNFCPFCGGPIQNLFQFCPNCGASLDLSMGSQEPAADPTMRADAPTFAPAFVPVPEPVHAPPPRPAPPPHGGGGMGGQGQSQLQASLGALLGQAATGGGGGGLGPNGGFGPQGDLDSLQFNSTVTDELDVMRGRMMLLAALKEMEKREVPGGDGLASVLAMGLGGGGGRPGGWP